MAAPFVAPKVTASLANMTSGTTFAAKARAAELNAVRSRRAAKELEIEDDVPSTTQVTLGAIRFTKARNHGRAWKALNLDDLPEGSENDQDPEHAQASRPDTPQSASESTYFGNFATSSTLYPQSFSSNLTQMGADYDPQEWIPDMPSVSTMDRATLSRRLSSQMTTQSRPSSVLSHRFVPEEGSSVNTGPAIGPFGEIEAGAGCLNGPGPLQEIKLGAKKALDNDDPFTELPQKLRQTLYDPNPYAQNPNNSTSSTSTIRPQPPASKGTMDYDFRFPLAHQPQQPASAQTAYLNASTKGQHIPSVIPHQRDPMPYTGFAASSKKELLLQTFNDAVESSKAEGSLPTSTRTVLYDPVARELTSQAQRIQPSTGLRQKSQTYPPDVGPSREASECDKEGLKASDPLPWKNRPVDVYDMTSPVDTNASFARPGGWPTSQLPPPGLYPENAYIWSLVPKPKPAGRSFEEAEKWFRKDARGLGGLEAYLEETTASQRSVKNLIVQRDMEKMSERRTSESSKWSGTSASTLIPEHGRNVEIANHLVGPVVGNLHGYINEVANPEVDYFGRLGRVPEWCIDKGQGSNTSFFGDWGVPPSRVGRDPRYRPTFHEGRYTVFEQMVRRGVREAPAGGFR